MAELTPVGSTLYAAFVPLSDVYLKMRILPLEEDDRSRSIFFWFWTHEIRLSLDIMI